MITTLSVNKIALENHLKFTQIYNKLFEWAASIQNAIMLK